MKKQQLIKRISDVHLVYKKPSEALAIRVLTSSDAVEPARQSIPEGQLELQEFFGILFLNRANVIMKRAIISSGGMSSTVVDPKLVFMHALLAAASGIIVFHNHPSNLKKPSQADLQLTKRIAECAALLDITLLDHLIITADSYFSFADDGLI
jgi:DNA repair protein RadC